MGVMVVFCLFPEFSLGSQGKTLSQARENHVSVQHLALPSVPAAQSGEV